MNTRERFNAIMNFEKPDRNLIWEMGYWLGTVDRWYGEGFPKKHGLSIEGDPGLGVRGEELESKIPFMLNKLGYIPHIDHLVHPDISWEDFCYYRKRLKEIIEVEAKCDIDLSAITKI